MYFHMFRGAGDFEILHGDVMGLPDTMSFLRSLAELDASNDTEKTTEKHLVRERKAAAGLFNWEVLLFLSLTFFLLFCKLFFHAYCYIFFFLLYRKIFMWHEHPEDWMLLEG